MEKILKLKIFITCNYKSKILQAKYIYFIILKKYLSK